MTVVSYPRRQRNRRLGHAAQYAATGFAALLLAAAGLGVGAPGIAVLLALVGVGLLLRSRHWLALARRSNVGALSEERVRAQLRPLESEGWGIQHSLGWRGGGDVDHLAIAPGPGGLVFPIETKTRSYAPQDLERVAAIAGALTKRRRWCRTEAIPILCLAGAHGVERWKAGVAVVSAERLLSLLRRLAGTTPRPRFLR